jgi:hypothetical protein
MTMYRVAVLKYGNTEIELDFKSFIDATDFMQIALRTTTVYISFRLETFEED